MSDEARTRLRQQQADLMAALSGQGDVPAGFDAHLVEVARRSLFHKRRRVVVKLWPGVIEELEGRFPALFEEYAEKHSLPTHGEGLADGRAFLRWLSKREALSDKLEQQAFLVDLRYQECEGLMPRRGPVILWRRGGVGIHVPWPRQFVWVFWWRRFIPRRTPGPTDPRSETRSHASVPGTSPSQS